MSHEVETLNMQTASLERVLQQIKDQLEDEDYTPITIIGKSGIGKTESISKLAKELGVGFKELRLGQYQESDLVGMPYVDGKRSKHALTDLLPDPDDKGKGILMLDEVTSSTRGMRSAVYQLLDSSRKLGEYRLPEKWMIIACGNGPQDGGDFRGIEPAFLSRGYSWRVEPNLATWKKWALARGIHPTILAFLSFMPEYLHYIDVDAPNDAIACPRNWTKLSAQLTRMEKRNNGVLTDPEEIQFGAGGAVGQRVSAQFAQFYKYSKAVINVEDIIAGKVKPEQMLDVTDEVLYITAQNLVSVLRDDINQHKAPTEAGVTDDCLQRVANTIKWVVSLNSVGVRLDVAITIITDLVSSVGNAMCEMMLTEEFDKYCPEFLSFCTDNHIVTQNK